MEEVTDTVVSEDGVWGPLGGQRVVLKGLKLNTDLITVTLTTIITPG